MILSSMNEDPLSKGIKPGRRRFVTEPGERPSATAPPRIGGSQRSEGLRRKRAAALQSVQLAVPQPGRSQYRVKLGVAGLPAELANGLFRARHQHRRISRPARV